MAISLTGQIVRVHQFEEASKFNGETRVCVTLMLSAKRQSGDDVLSYVDCNMDLKSVEEVEIDMDYANPVEWKELIVRKGDIVTVSTGILTTKTYLAKDKTWKANIVCNAYDMKLRFKAKDNMTEAEMALVANRKTASAAAQKPVAKGKPVIAAQADRWASAGRTKAAPLATKPAPVATKPAAKASSSKAARKPIVHEVDPEDEIASADEVDAF